MGSCGTALAAYTIIPTLSLTNWFNKAETNLFAFSILFGAISSVSILFETSIANTMSTPSLFTVSNLVPILGLTSPNEIEIIPNDIIINFKKPLKLDFSGLSFSNILLEINCFCVFFFHTDKKKKIAQIKGIEKSI